MQFFLAIQIPDTFKVNLLILVLVNFVHKSYKQRPLNHGGSFFNKYFKRNQWF